MQATLKLFLKWGITFEEPYELQERVARKVSYADKHELEMEIMSAKKEHTRPGIISRKLPVRVD